MSNITFVDDNDELIGYGTKKEAIAKGIAHRISRIFVFNSAGELLIQKRSPFVNVPNRWDQSAAGHVDEGEDYATAAARELEEEVGISGVPLKEVAKMYSEELDDGFVKKRFNVIFTTKYDGNIKTNEREVSDYKWIKPEELERWMQDSPDDFTQGFLQNYKHFADHNK